MHTRSGSHEQERINLTSSEVVLDADPEEEFRGESGEESINTPYYVPGLARGRVGVKGNIKGNKMAARSRTRRKWNTLTSSNYISHSKLKAFVQSNHSISIDFDIL